MPGHANHDEILARDVEQALFDAKEGIETQLSAQPAFTQKRSGSEGQKQVSCGQSAALQSGRTRQLHPARVGFNVGKIDPIGQEPKRRFG